MFAIPTADFAVPTADFAVPTASVAVSVSVSAVSRAVCLLKPCSIHILPSIFTRIIFKIWVNGFNSPFSIG